MEEKKIGHVTHYFTAIGVASIKLTNSMKVGDIIHIKGHTSDFTQKVETMQIEHDKISEAKKGDEVGIKVTEHAREHDTVYKVTE